MPLDTIKDPVTGQQYSRDPNIIGSTYKPYTPPTSINGTNTQPSTPIPYSSPTPTPIPPIGGLTEPTVPETTLTPKESEAQALSERVQSLYGDVAGKASYQAEQEKLAGVSEARKLERDLSAQLFAIKNESVARNIQLEKEAAEGGVTTA